MKRTRYPKGWNAARVQRVLEQYEAQTEAEAVAEDEAAFAKDAVTVMKVPAKLVPAVRQLIAKQKAKKTAACEWASSSSRMLSKPKCGTVGAR